MHTKILLSNIKIALMLIKLCHSYWSISIYYCLFFWNSIRYIESTVWNVLFLTSDSNKALNYSQIRLNFMKIERVYKIKGGVAKRANSTKD